MRFRLVGGDRNRGQEHRYLLFSLEPDGLGIEVAVGVERKLGSGSRGRIEQSIDNLARKVYVHSYTRRGRR
jgi:hypothetical protein